jgi:hypothetical protein
MKHPRLILGASLVCVIAAALAADQPSPGPFKIAVDLSGNEAKMRCISGCNWITTAYSCGPAASCSFELDEMGVKGVATSATR